MLMESRIFVYAISTIFIERYPIRTGDLRLRRPTLYPSELIARSRIRLVRARRRCQAGGAPRLDASGRPVDYPLDGKHPSRIGLSPAPRTARERRHSLQPVRARYRREPLRRAAARGQGDRLGRIEGARRCPRPQGNAASGPRGRYSRVPGSAGRGFRRTGLGQTGERRLGAPDDRPSRRQDAFRTDGDSPPRPRERSDADFPLGLGDQLCPHGPWGDRSLRRVGRMGRRSRGE